MTMGPPQKEPMAAKMHVLPRREGPRVVPRVVVDRSMSLSFQLPAGYRSLRARPAASAPRPPPSSPPANASTANVDGDDSDGWENVSREVDESKQVEPAEEESWETHDWSGDELPSACAPLSAAATTTAMTTSTTTTASIAAPRRRVLAMQSLEAPVAAEPWQATTALEDDSWESTAVEDLPDDFPVLLVNLTRLRDAHFRDPSAAGGYAVAMDTDEDLRAFYETVKVTLYEHFSQLTEGLFEEQICFHASYGTKQRILDNLHLGHPRDIFAVIDYPTELSGLALHEYLHVLTKPTRWPSLNYLKDCLRRCSRDLEWKFEIAIELERLAEDEHTRWTQEREALGDEIDDLTRLRASFREKLAKLQDDGARASANREYFLLRKLEDVENRLASLLDDYLQEPELDESEMRDLVGFHTAEPAIQMRNVLDMVVAMIFGRLPRDFSAEPTREAHFDMLLDHHLHIRRLWKKDFGRLPARQAPVGHETPGSACEDVMALAEDVDAGLHIDHSFDDVGPDAHECRSTVGVAGVDRDHDHGDLCVDTRMGDPAGIPRMDGYSGDYDSSESDDEDGAKGQTPDAPSIADARPKTSSRKPRRPMPSSFHLSLAPAQGTEEVTTSTTKKTKSSKKSKKKKSTTRGKKNSDQDEAFLPYACTGALGLLQLAKDNETF